MGRKAAAIIKNVKDLAQDARNANVGTDRGRAMLEMSVRRYGLGRPVLADRQGRLIAGNKTALAAIAAGTQKVRVVQTTGDELVVHQRTDLDLERDPDAKALAIADNRANEVGLKWSAPVLEKMDTDGVDMKPFFRSPEWDKLVNPDAVQESDAGEEIPEMGIQPFEHHDYIVVVFRDSHAWTRACDRLGIRREKAVVGGRVKIGLGRVITGERLLEVLDGKGKKRAPKERASKVAKTAPAEVGETAEMPPAELELPA